MAARVDSSANAASSFLTTSKSLLGQKLGAEAREINRLVDLREKEHVASMAFRRRRHLPQYSGNSSVVLRAAAGCLLAKASAPPRPGRMPLL